MGIAKFWDKIRSRFGKTPPSHGRGVAGNAPAEYKQVLEFNGRVRTLLKEDKFIARSDYKELVSQYSPLYGHFEALQKADVVNDYVEKHGLDFSEIENFLRIYGEIKDLKNESATIRKHNDAFVSRHLMSEKDYLDAILRECDPNISLDNEQREVVLSDEDYTLVVAGAGAGKTTTVSAKVRYLVEKRHVNPDKILVISFTNKAVDELRSRINGDLKIPCPIYTFHSVGYSILRNGDKTGKKVMGEGFRYVTISKYLRERVLADKELVDKLVLFFGSYFNAPYEGEQLNEYFLSLANADTTTLKSNLKEYAEQIVNRQTRTMRTLNNELLRSMEEVRIANFLYMNQIDYEYEPMYQHSIMYAHKPYTPDFRIRQGEKTAYIEHFGITEDGHNSRYDENTLAEYKNRINDKIRLHRKHKTTLLYTFSKYNDGRDYTEHLREQLIDAGYVLRPRSTEDVYKKLVDREEGKYITPLTFLISTFIGNFKTQGYKSDKFGEFIMETKNERTKLFLEICRTCFLEYQRVLAESNGIDFEDMINESAELVRKRKFPNDRPDFEYIIVDEYQDISRQRYNLIKELSELCYAKIVAVGDDWQSIYAFSGSVLPLFTQFCDTLGYAQELKITRTYRNAQEVIDIAGRFIQQNSAQIRKKLISPKRIANPVNIYAYSEKAREGQKDNRDYCLGLAVNDAIEDILKYNDAEGKKGVASVLLLGRYGFDARNLSFSGEFDYNEKKGTVYSKKYGNRVKLNFMTAHSSKGLSADNVIIINAKDTVYGFPSKVGDDPVLKLVVSEDSSFNYAEERRLFYVALTRTRNRVFIVTPEKRPSEFIKELLADPKKYPNVKLNGEMKTDLTISRAVRNKCPVCGYPLQYRWKKNYGLKLYICTNDQEVCGFMTNDINGGILSIHKCDWCKDGYLVVKKGLSDYILGCTNYNPDKSGCGRMLSYDNYLSWLND